VGLCLTQAHKIDLYGEIYTPLIYIYIYINLALFLVNVDEISSRTSQAEEQTFEHEIRYL